MVGLVIVRGGNVQDSEQAIVWDWDNWEAESLSERLDTLGRLVLDLHTHTIVSEEEMTTFLGGAATKLLNAALDNYPGR